MDYRPPMFPPTGGAAGVSLPPHPHPMAAVIAAGNAAVAATGLTPNPGHLGYLFPPHPGLVPGGKSLAAPPLPPSPSPGIPAATSRPPSVLPVVHPQPAPSPTSAAKLNSFAAALRDLAKNAETQEASKAAAAAAIAANRSVNGNVNSSLMDIRKGFSKSPPTVSTSSSDQPHSGFQPYQGPDLRLPGGVGLPFPTPGSGYPPFPPSLMAPSLGALPAPFGMDMNPVYRAQLENYLTAMGLAAAAGVGTPVSLAVSAQPSVSLPANSPRAPPTPAAVAAGGGILPPPFGMPPSSILQPGFPAELLRGMGGVANNASQQQQHQVAVAVSQQQAAAAAILQRELELLAASTAAAAAAGKPGGVATHLLPTQTASSTKTGPKPAGKSVGTPGYSIVGPPSTSLSTSTMTTGSGASIGGVRSSPNSGPLTAGGRISVRDHRSLTGRSPLPAIASIPSIMPPASTAGVTITTTTTTAMSMATTAITASSAAVMSSLMMLGLNSVASQAMTPHNNVSLPGSQIPISLPLKPNAASHATSLNVPSSAASILKSTGLQLPTQPLDFSSLKDSLHQMGQHGAGSPAQPTPGVPIAAVSTSLALLNTPIIHHVSSAPASPSPPPPITSPETVSRCMPYVPRSERKRRLDSGSGVRGSLSESAPPFTSTPKRPFVRPFEDSYVSDKGTSPTDLPSPVVGDRSLAEEITVIHAAARSNQSKLPTATTAGSQMLPPPPAAATASSSPLLADEKNSGSGEHVVVVVDNVVTDKPPNNNSSASVGQKLELMSGMTSAAGHQQKSDGTPAAGSEYEEEDQDSDYESMSSDSSTRRETTALLCPTSGRLITEDEAHGSTSSGHASSADEAGLSTSSNDISATTASEPKSSEPHTSGSDANPCDVAGSVEAATSDESPPPEEEMTEVDDSAVLLVLDESRFREPELSTSSMREKLRYLRYFRLITHSKKNDVEIAKLEKRRSRLRERSPTPPPSPLIISGTIVHPPVFSDADLDESGRRRAASPALPLPSVPPHLNRLPESQPKSMYMSAIGLCGTNEEQRHSAESVWSAVLTDRLARGETSAINTYFVRLKEMTDKWESKDKDNDNADEICVIEGSGSQQDNQEDSVKSNENQTKRTTSNDLSQFGGTCETDTGKALLGPALAAGMLATNLPSAGTVLLPPAGAGGVPIPPTGFILAPDGSISTNNAPPGAAYITLHAASGDMATSSAPGLQILTSMSAPSLHPLSSSSQQLSPSTVNSLVSSATGLMQATSSAQGAPTAGLIQLSNNSSTGGGPITSSAAGFPMFPFPLPPSSLANALAKLPPSCALPPSSVSLPSLPTMPLIIDQNGQPLALYPPSLVGAAGSGLIPCSQAGGGLLLMAGGTANNAIEIKGVPPVVTSGMNPLQALPAMTNGNFQPGSTAVGLPLKTEESPATPPAAKKMKFEGGVEATGSQLKWPGIEAVIDSFVRYKKDCDEEAAELRQRCTRAESELAVKRSQVDSLSTRLAGLARLQQTLAANHVHDQAATDTLMAGIRALASLPVPGSNNGLLLPPVSLPTADRLNSGKLMPPVATTSAPANAITSGHDAMFSGGGAKLGSALVPSFPGPVSMAGGIPMSLAAMPAAALAGIGPVK